MIDALVVIISKSPAAAAAAAQCIKSVNAKSPRVAQNYLDTVQDAFSDPQARFSDEERELIASYLESESTRNVTLRVRLTQAEAEQLKSASDSLRQTMSEYVRSRILNV